MLMRTVNQYALYQVQFGLLQLQNAFLYSVVAD
jgi:hypothetical protein